MNARIRSLLGFGGVAGVAAQNGSAYGPSDCPLCCGFGERIGGDMTDMTMKRGPPGPSRLDSLTV